MRVSIEFELDVDGMDEGQIDDLIADYTYDMRTSKYLRTGSWRINYTVPEESGLDESFEYWRPL